MTALVEMFQPPEGLFGHQAVLTAFTATEQFLEEAVLRFTGLSKRRRAVRGATSVFLMLDAQRTKRRREILRPGQVPALFELSPGPALTETLLHAKVAVLTFGRTRSGPPTHARLLVTTANWTDTSAAHQLELLWHVDAQLARGPERGAATDRADIAAAADFIESVARHFVMAPDIRNKFASTLSFLREDRPQIAARRFLHSLRQSQRADGRYVPLLEQLRERAPVDRDRPRDFLLCGSGFFEEPTNKAAKPEVLARLENLPGLRLKEKNVVVNPDRVGAIAEWDAGEDGWNVVEATDPLAKGRKLHAKYIYVGRRWGESARDGWLYLGSGNLTKRGLLLAPFSKERGNIEAGVVLELPDKLTEEELDGLFFGASPESLDGSELEAGLSEEEVEEVVPDEGWITAAPILLARAMPDADGGVCLVLDWDEAAARDGVEVRLADAWIPVDPTSAPLRLADGQIPPRVRVRRGKESWVVAVMDLEGRVAREPDRALGFKDALHELLSFPVPPPEDDDDGDEDDEGADDGEPNEGDHEGGGGSDGDDDLEGGADALATDAPPRTGRRSLDEGVLDYPLLEVMELLEAIAQKQVELAGPVLSDWIGHLETALKDGFSAKAPTWRTLGVPFFATLREPGFAPERMDDEQARAYAGALARVAAAWGFNNAR